MLLPVGASGAPGEISSWDWEPAVTLTRAIERGVATPARAFALYLKANDPLLDGVVLAFTTDDRVVFGVSVDDPDGQEERLALAKLQMEALAEEFDAEAGYIAVEEPAPLLAANIPPVDSTRVLFSWSRNAFC